MNDLFITICEEMGDLFVLSGKLGFDSEDFITKFMLSETCRKMDIPFSHMQFAGMAYIMETFLDEIKNRVKKSSRIFCEDALFWIGYIYRYWSFYKKEKSKNILKEADARTMAIVYEAFHCLSEEMAIDRLRESYKKKLKKSKEAVEKA